MYVSMKGMLQRANEGNYAVMAINCFNIETARAVISAAQDLRAPIIVNIVQEHMVNHCDSELIAPIVKLLAQGPVLKLIKFRPWGRNRIFEKKHFMTDIPVSWWTPPAMIWKAISK